MRADENYEDVIHQYRQARCSESTGTGLLDHKKYEVYTCITPNPTDIWLPTIIETKEVPIEARSSSSEHGKRLEEKSLLSNVCWTDEANMPEDKDHFLLTLLVDHPHPTNGTLRNRSTLVWGLPKKFYRCYSFFQSQREKHLLREQGKDGFVAFLSTVPYSEESASALLDRVAVPEVLHLIHAFVCGPPVIGVPPSW